MNVLRVILLLCALGLGIPCHASIEAEDWQKYIDEGCSPTLRGQAKKLMGELDFWSRVEASMWSWYQTFDAPSATQYCAARFSTPNKRAQYMQCSAYAQAQLHWFQRCRPVAVQFCRQAGGKC